MSAKKLRKQVYELTSDDLLAHPVWQFALGEEGEEGQDEATVGPLIYEGKLDPSWGSCVIRAHFLLADGTQLPGYLTPPPHGLEGEGLGLIQPCITTADGQISFWCGILEPSPEDISSSYRRLGKKLVEEIFPIRFSSAVELINGPVTGAIPGFLVLKDWKTRKTRIVT